MNFEARDKNGFTPLHSAETADIVTVLLQAGADLQSRSMGGFTPLCIARALPKSWRRW